MPVIQELELDKGSLFPVGASKKRLEKLQPGEAVILPDQGDPIPWTVLSVR
jgi:hypothetical protein